MSDVAAEIAQWMSIIPKTGDDQEIWACEGAIEELRYYVAEEADTDEDRNVGRAIIAALSARRRRLIEEVRA